MDFERDRSKRVTKVIIHRHLFSSVIRVCLLKEMLRRLKVVDNIA